MAGQQSIRINKKILKNALKNVNSYMDNAIKLIGETNTTDENTLINKIETLNKEFHDTETVSKAYEDVNKSLAKLEEEMKQIDDKFIMLQSYYDLLESINAS